MNRRHTPHDSRTSPRRSPDRLSGIRKTLFGTISSPKTERQTDRSRRRSAYASSASVRTSRHRTEQKDGEYARRLALCFLPATRESPVPARNASRPEIRDSRPAGFDVLTLCHSTGIPYPSKSPFRKSSKSSSNPFSSSPPAIAVSSSTRYKSQSVSLSSPMSTKE